MAGKITRRLRHDGISYKGINVVMLWSASVVKGYACPLWLTFKQALELGGDVKKGERGALLGRQVSAPLGRLPVGSSHAIGESLPRSTIIQVLLAF